LKAKAIVFAGINNVDVQEVKIPEPGEGEVLIETIYSVASPGTELRCLAGKQDGAVFPFIPGYSSAGRVIAAGNKTGISEGELVYFTGTANADCNLTWGGHISHALQSEQYVYRLSDSIDPLWGAAAHLVGIAYRGVRFGQPKPQDAVALIGLGAIGAIAARIYAISGANVVAADLSSHRVSITRDAGIDAMVVGDNITEAFREKLPGGADLVVDATGQPAVLRDAIEIVKDKSQDDSSINNPRVVIQGSYSDDVCFPYNTAFKKEIMIYVPRDVQPGDIITILDLIENNKIKLDGIISDIRKPEEAMKTYKDLADPEKNLITVAFKWK